MKKEKKGFTLVELLAVIVVLAVVILIAVTAIIPRMNKAKKNALIDEAHMYLKASNEMFSIDDEEEGSPSCISIDDLNGEYIKKDSNDYSGAILIDYNNGEMTQTIHLTDGKYYVVGSGNLTIDDVDDEMPKGFASSCYDYNPILLDGVDTNTLAYKLVMNEGGSTLDDNLDIINERTSTIDVKVAETDPSKSGLYHSEDDDGASFYYRGVVNNNWVEFGGFYWRIIRINGDGSIRMIYSGAKNSTHTGSDAEIARISFHDLSSKYLSVNDISGLTNNSIQVPYYNGEYNHSYLGYMYNPELTLTKYPINELSETNDLGSFITFDNIVNSHSYYLFKNFNESTDCIKTGDDTVTATCVLKCRELGNDCVYTNWNSYATTAGNYSTSDPGIYPSSNPTNYVYKSDYKYTCFENGEPVVVENSDGTTSVYVSCAVLTEIMGTVKNKATEAKVRIIGFHPSSPSSATNNVKDSLVKQYLDSWYEENILGKYDSTGTNSKLLELYLSDEIFCNDRSFSTTEQEYPFNRGNSFRYEVSARLKQNQITTPTFKCKNINRDGFTMYNSSNSLVTSKNKGNRMLKYPIGLITADDIVFAGCGIGSTNKSFYIYYGPSLWTMTPYLYYTSDQRSYIVAINKSGKLTSHSVDEQDGIRPVINLKSSVLWSSGSGTESDPYKVTISTI